MCFLLILPWRGLVTKFNAIDQNDAVQISPVNQENTDTYGSLAGKGSECLGHSVMDIMAIWGSTSSPEGTTIFQLTQHTLWLN